jgi:ferrous iron transport protein B
MIARKRVLVALAGQPNVGKSTVFSILTGLSQHVGNWPGKTVEKKEGVHVSGEAEINVVDLPGTYSLTAFSAEERIAMDFIIKDRPDVIVLIANSSALERSLYLLSELLCLGLRYSRSEYDRCSKGTGYFYRCALSREILGVPVVPMVAAKNRGVKELVQEIIFLSGSDSKYSPRIPEVFEDHRDVFTALMKEVKEFVPRPYTAHWAVTKLMEGDPEVFAMMEQILPVDKLEEVRLLLRRHEDSLLAVVHGRYDWIEAIIRSCVSKFKKGQVLLTDRIDHILIRPVFGIPILLGILAFVFFITYRVGAPVQGLLQSSVKSFANWIEPYLAGTPKWVAGILIDGALGGAGTVLTFIPILLLFFAFMAFLEDVGYMARAAFVMDRFMHIIGLHGKSFMPMFLGFGCNVPAVLGTRIVESRRARLLTIFLTPFMPCTARLAVLTLVATAVFGEQAPLVTWSLVSVNILALGF